MPQVTTVIPPPPISAQGEEFRSQGYPINFHPTFACNPKCERLATELGNYWPPPHELMQDSQLPDVLQFNNDTLLDYEASLPNKILPNINAVGLWQDQDPGSFNTAVPSLPYIESSSSTVGREPSEIPDNVMQKLRSSSAPDLNAQALAQARERQLKHVSRRASHNVVEKRYRIKLNSKFRELEEVITRGTEQHTISKISSAATQRQGPPKSSIIDSALSYIENLQSEIKDLKGKIEILETSNPCFGHQEGFRNSY